MNDILDLIKDRRSVRSYLDKPVEEEKIDKILEAGIYSPSGQNSQNPIFIAVTDKDTIKKLSEINAKAMNAKIDPFYGAKAVIVVLANKDYSTYVCDGSIAMQSMMLEAKSLDLDSCWIHRAKEEFENPIGKEILSKLNIHGNYEGIGNLILGYRAKDFKPHPRKGTRAYYIK